MTETLVRVLKRRRSARGVSLALVISAAMSWSCSGAAQRASATPTVAPPPVQLRLEETRVTVLPGVGLPSWVGGAEGANFYRLGSLRAVQEGARVRFAEATMAAEIVAAVRVANGWVFLDANGLATTSETFDGPLRLLGEVPEGRRGRVDEEPTPRRSVGTGSEQLRAIPAARGRLAVVDAFGRVWSTDGTSPIAPIPSLPIAAREVAFYDADHGLAVMANGTVMRTADGGTSWQRVESVVAANQVVVRAAGFLVFTPNGDTAILPDGTQGDAVMAGEARDPDGTTREDQTAVITALLARDPPVLTSRQGHPGRNQLLTTWLEPGRMAYFDRVARERRVVSTPSSECLDSSAWGERVVLECRRAEHTRYVSDDWEHFEPLPDTPDHERAITMFSDDGEHAVLATACDGSDPPDGHSAFCVLPSRHASAWHDVSIPLHLHPVSELHGDALMLTPRELSDEEERNAIDAETVGRSKPVEVGTLLQLDRTTVTPVRAELVGFESADNYAWGAWASDGTAWFLSRESIEPGSEPPPIIDDAGRADASANSGGDDAARVLPFLIGDPRTGVLVRQLLPAGVTSVAFNDAQHGVAAGPTLDTLVRTEDGGKHWSRIVVPFQSGDASTVVLDRSQPVSPAIACTATECWIGTRVHVEGTAHALTVASPRPIAVHMNRVEIRPQTNGWTNANLPALTCSAEGPDRRTTPGSIPHVPAHARRAAFALANHDVALATWNDGAALHVRARWSGVDEHGRYDVTSRDASVAAGEMEPQARYDVEAIDRRGVIVSRCVTSPCTQSELLWMTPGGVSRLVRTVNGELQPLQGSVANAFWLENGDVVLLLNVALERHVVRVAGGGVVISETSVQTDTPLGVAWAADRAGEPGVVIAGVHDPTKLIFSPLDPAPGEPSWDEDVAPVDAPAVPFCRGDSQSVSLRLHATASVYLRGLALGRERDREAEDWSAPAVLEVTADGMCARSIHLHLRAPHDSEVEITADDHGALRAVEAHGPTRRTLRCTAAP